MIDAVIWKVKVVGDVRGFFVYDASSVVIYSYIELFCCQSYILLFALLACDKVDQVGRDTAEVVSDGVGCPCFCRRERFAAVEMFACYASGVVAVGCPHSWSEFWKSSSCSVCGINFMVGYL